MNGFVYCSHDNLQPQSIPVLVVEAVFFFLQEEEEEAFINLIEIILPPEIEI